MLENELRRRIGGNPHYSMRAFAHSLGISHSLLSLVLNGKKAVSRKLREKAEALAPAVEDSSGSFQDIPLRTFEVLADWCHYPILSLLEIPGMRFEPRWIAKALSISEAEASLAMSRLKRMGIVKLRRGVWKQSTRPLKLDNMVSTPATRKHHHQIMQRAAASLDNDAMEKRDFSCITFAIDPQNLEYARKRITQFRRQLMKELETAGKPNQVYQLAIQLFPVTHLNPKENS